MRAPLSPSMSSIDDSPRMQAQRRTINSIFGNAAKRPFHDQEAIVQRRSADARWNSPKGAEGPQATVQLASDELVESIRASLGITASQTSALIGALLASDPLSSMDTLLDAIAWVSQSLGVGAWHAATLIVDVLYEHPLAAAGLGVAFLTATYILHSAGYLRGPDDEASAAGVDSRIGTESPATETVSSSGSQESVVEEVPGSQEIRTSNGIPDGNTGQSEASTKAGKNRRKKATRRQQAAAELENEVDEEHEADEELEVDEELEADEELEVEDEHGPQEVNVQDVTPETTPGTSDARAKEKRKGKKVANKRGKKSNKKRNADRKKRRNPTQSPYAIGERFEPRRSPSDQTSLDMDSDPNHVRVRLIGSHVFYVDCRNGELTRSDDGTKPLAVLQGWYSSDDGVTVVRAELHVHFNNVNPINSHTGAHVKLANGEYVNTAFLERGEASPTLMECLQITFADRWKALIAYIRKTK